MLLSGVWGKVIHEKNLKQKISWHCPLTYMNCTYRWRIRNTDESYISAGILSRSLIDKKKQEKYIMANFLWLFFDNFFV